MSASPTDSTEETAVAFPPTYIVVQFSRHIQTAALAWLLDKICGKRLDGGAELLVRKQPHRNKEVSTRGNIGSNQVMGVLSVYATSLS
jgi:anoctamin-10